MYNVIVSNVLVLSFRDSNSVMILSWFCHDIVKILLYTRASSEFLDIDFQQNWKL